MSTTDLSSLPKAPAEDADVRAPAFPLATGSAAFLREEADRYEGISKLFGFDDPADEERQKEHCAHLRAAADEIDRLRAALADADMAICAGQACRSEAEFTRWMRDSQRYRPHADLLSPNGSDEPRGGQS